MKRFATTGPKLFNFLIQMLITFFIFKAIATKLGMQSFRCLSAEFMYVTRLFVLSIGC